MFFTCWLQCFILAARTAQLFRMRKLGSYPIIMVSQIHHKRFWYLKPHVIHISLLASMIWLILSETLWSLLSSQNVVACIWAQPRLTNRIKNVRPCTGSDGILRIKYSATDSCPVSEANGRRIALSAESSRATLLNATQGSQRINTKKILNISC